MEFDLLQTLTGRDVDNLLECMYIGPVKIQHNLDGDCFVVSDITEEKIDVFKKSFLVGSSLLAILLLYLIDITRNMLIVYILQNLVIMVIIDILSKINVRGIFKITKNYFHSRFECIDPMGAVNKRIESNVVIDNLYMKPPYVCKTDKKPSIRVTRVKEKKRRTFRLTRIGRYLFPKKC